MKKSKSKLNLKNPLLTLLIGVLIGFAGAQFIGTNLEGMIFNKKHASKDIDTKIVSPDLGLPIEESESCECIDCCDEILDELSTIKEINLNICHKVESIFDWSQQTNIWLEEHTEYRDKDTLPSLEYYLTACETYED